MNAGLASSSTISDISKTLAGIKEPTLNDSLLKSFESIGSLGLNENVLGQLKGAESTIAKLGKNIGK